MGRTYKDAKDVELVMVSLDRDKAALEGFARTLKDTWTVLCDYKVYDTRAARAYGVSGVPSTLILDGRGRVRQGAGFGWKVDTIIEYLRLEAFWEKHRESSPQAKDPDEPETSSEPPASKPAAPAIRWILHLKSGGKLKAVSYEEQGDKYAVILAAGKVSIAKDTVERIESVESGGK